MRRASEFAIGKKLTARSVANVFHAIAKLCAARRLNMTDKAVEETWEALEDAAVRVAPEMTPQDVANTTWVYAKLGRMPEGRTWEALEGAAVRVALKMDPQNVANTMWACTTLSTLRRVNLPPSYAAIWELACNMEAREFDDEGLRMLFHAHLMHDRLLSIRQATANARTPGWLMAEARDAWLHSARDDTTTSKSQSSWLRPSTSSASGTKWSTSRMTDTSRSTSTCLITT